jgi:hypothetical protein
MAVVVHECVCVEVALRVCQYFANSFEEELLVFSVCEYLSMLYVLHYDMV